MLERIIRPIKNKLYNIVGRAVVTALNNSGKTLKAQVVMFQSETFDGIDVLQNYGFESLADAADNDNEVVLASIGGNRVMSTVTAIHNRTHRPKTLAAGEVQVYTKFGSKVHLKADGSVVVTESGGAVLTMAGGVFTLEGSVNLKGTGGKAVMIDTIIAKFNAHTHICAIPGNPSAVPATLWVDGVDSAADVKAKV